MARERQNPEDEKDLSKITKVILKDLKGRREVQHDFSKKKKIYTPKKRTEKEDVQDHTQWMPKYIPREMKRAIKETEKPRKEPAAPKQKISVRKKKDSFEYVIQLKSGKIIKSKRVIIKGDKVVLINEEMEIAIPASSIKLIKESRVRIMILE
ncbi:MAG: hypothetical protein D3922_04060 [Candidatus Electrothrix sp. AR1]|nr:hypothetical protein [Candidatus Electrothrix sp. AR1]